MLLDQRVRAGYGGSVIADLGRQGEKTIMATSDRRIGRRWSLAAGGGLAVALLLASAGGALAQSAVSEAPVAEDTAPTFSRDVAPILQRSCQRCHQPTGIGPMSLLTYREVRPWARSIRDRVERRLMPPWHLDPTVGIQGYKNDISLTPDEIDTVVRWVDTGAPEGDPADLPEPLEFPRADAWEVEAMLGRPPDVIVRAKPYTVVANGQDQWWEPEIEFEGFDVPRYIRAAEFKPSYPIGIKVTHQGTPPCEPRSPPRARSGRHPCGSSAWGSASGGMCWPRGSASCFRRARAPSASASITSRWAKR